MNEVQLVGSQSSEVIVKNYHWTGFLAPNFERVIQLKRQHHFEITITSPRKLHTRKFVNTINKEQTLLKNLFGIPKMNFLRKTYQLDSYSRDSGTCMTKLLSSVLIKQETCVSPPEISPTISHTKSNSSPSLPTTSTSSTTQTNTSAPKKRKRICGECG